jgi:hypothetical protein
MIAFAFLNPLLLWGLPLAAVPIIIHLLNRRRFQRVPWAAMEYLLAAMKRNRKRMRMEQWLVLLLRTLAVLFLVMLVARPQLSGGGVLGTRTHHIVILDDSASMQQRSGNTSNLHDRARDVIRQLADQFADRRGGDLFSLVRSSKPGVPELWSQRIGPDLGKRIGSMLKELPAGDGVLDLAPLITTTAQRAAETKDAGHTEIYLVTDLRSSDWITDDDKPRPAVASAIAGLDGKTTHLTIASVGSKDADNLAVAAVRRVGRLTASGVSLDFAVDVQNFGLDASAATEIAVEVDGKSRVTQPVPQLAPGERVSVPIAHTFHGAGFHRLEASLPATDHYPLDDRATLVLPVPEKSKVLLVDGEPGESTEDGEARYLQVALDQGGEVATGIEPQVITDAALNDTDLAPFDFVWLCNMSAPSPAVVAKLESFVTAGGGLGIFAGSQVDPTRWNDAMWQQGKGLLPLPFGELQGDPDKPEHLFLADKNHPLCGKSGEGLGVFLGLAVLVKRHLTMTEPAEARAAVMTRVRDAEGSPVIASKVYGNGGGTVIQFGITADEHWSNWPKTPANLVVAQEAQRFAARPQDLQAFNFGTRGVQRLSLDQGIYKADVRVRALAGADEEHTFTATEPKVAPAAPGTVPAADAKPAGSTPLSLDIPMSELRALGAFEVTLQPHSGLPEVRMLARNVPIEESRLVRFAETEFRRVYPSELHDKLAFRDESAGLGSSAGEGELWRTLGIVMLLALLLETVLAWRFGRR